MKTPLARLHTLLVIPACWLQLTPSHAQGTAFTYQGRLNDSGPAANGLYDLRFTIYDAFAGGTGVAGPLTNSPTSVSNGLFTVGLDFGPGVFTGPARWLQIDVRTNGATGFTALSPRQQLTAAPYAVFAGGASNFVGSITGNGAGLTNVNAATVGGLAGTNLWQTGGNVGTTPGVNFLGTIDNQPVELHAGGLRVLRLEPGPAAAGAPNLIGGAPLNAVLAGVGGATIAGGGITNGIFGFPAINSVGSSFGTIGGGWDNAIQSNSFSTTIAGGVGNVIQTNATEAVIGGGNENTVLINANDATLNGGLMNSVAAAYTTLGGGVKNSIEPITPGSTIGGGATNRIQFQAGYATVAGGNNNTISTNASYSSLGGGGNNAILTASQGSTIAGGNNNSIQANSSAATIGGGAGNSIQANGSYSVVSGGFANAIQSFASGSVIAGGQNNTIQFDAYSSAVAGGYLNVIHTNANFAFIGGGDANSIQASAPASFIGGGQSNVVTGSASFGTIGGGSGNAAFGFAATVGGGYANSSGQIGSTVAGGYLNNCPAPYATVVGGYQNASLANYAALGGGCSNFSAGAFGTVGGGNQNNQESDYGAIGGGLFNSVAFLADGAVVGGGTSNAILASATYAAIGGGLFNTNSGAGATVAGGEQNTVSGTSSTVAGGTFNLGSGTVATVGGGYNNVASGTSSTVPGGANNQASGYISFAAGYRAQALHPGAFVWADNQEANFSSTRADQFAVRAGGGVVFNVSGSVGLNPAALLINSTSTNGVALDAAQTSSDATAVLANAGSGDLIRGFSGPSAASLVFQVQNNGTVCAANVSCASDRNLKAGFEPVAADNILTKVAALPISRWHYTNDAATSHIGPMAQDFNAAFTVGPDDKHITTLDEGGVALAAIQALNAKLEDKTAEIRDLQHRNELLARRLEALEQAAGNARSPAQPQKGEL